MLQVTKAGESEAGIISELASLIWPVSYREMLSPEQISNMLEKIYSVPALIHQMQENQKFFLISENGKNIGYLSLIPDGKTLWLKKLYLLPETQGQGYGQEIIEYVAENHRQFGTLSLYVNRDNLKAQSFYRKMGFFVISEVPVQMGDYHFIDLIMSRKARH